MAQEMVDMRGQMARLLFPRGETPQCADTDPAKTCRVGPFRTIESPIKILFRPGGVKFRISVTVVSFLENDQPFRTRLDNRFVIDLLHRPDLQRKSGYESAQALHALGQII